MASNFRIFIHRNGENIHLKLIGEFDGSSACQLMDTITQKAPARGNIYIHTSGLSTIHPFGKDLFREKVKRQHKTMGTITLTGEYATQLSFPGSRCC